MYNTCWSTELHCCACGVFGESGSRLSDWTLHTDSALINKKQHITHIDPQAVIPRVYFLKYDYVTQILSFLLTVQALQKNTDIDPSEHTLITTEPEIYIYFFNLGHRACELWCQFPNIVLPFEVE